MRALLAVLLLTVPAPAAEDPADCPTGTQQVSTDDPYQPFKCVKEKDKGLGAVAGPQGFKFRPKCPHGTRPAAGSGRLQPYRCVPATTAASEPELAPLRGGAGSASPAAEPRGGRSSQDCPPGKRMVPSPDPLRPFRCVQEHSEALLGADSFRRYSIPGELSFDYPRAFQSRDAWQDEVPTLSFTLDDGSPGKPVSITLTRAERSQTGFVELGEAIAKEMEWQGAKDEGTASVAGLRARLIVVPGESNSAYLPLSRDAYYALAYSAPLESYHGYLAAYQRLLKTFRLVRRTR